MTAGAAREYVTVATHRLTAPGVMGRRSRGNRAAVATGGGAVAGRRSMGARGRGPVRPPPHSASLSRPASVSRQMSPGVAFVATPSASRRSRSHHHAGPGRGRYRYASSVQALARYPGRSAPRATGADTWRGCRTGWALRGHWPGVALAGPAAGTGLGRPSLGVAGTLARLVLVRPRNRARSWLAAPLWSNLIASLVSVDPRVTTSRAGAGRQVRWPLQCGPTGPLAAAGLPQVLRVTLTVCPTWTIVLSRWKM